MLNKDKVEFTSSLHKTIVLNPEISIFGGVNRLSREAIEKFGIDKLDFVKLPKGWNKTRSIIKDVVITDEPPMITPKQKVVEYEEVPFDTELAELNKSKPKWAGTKILGVEINKAKAMVDKQDSISKLIEVLNISKSKAELHSHIVNRIKELDPDNPYLPRD